MVFRFVYLFALQVHQILKTVQLSEEESSKHRNVEGTCMVFYLRNSFISNLVLDTLEFKEFLQLCTKEETLAK